MARIMGAFGDRSRADAVVEQLQFNGVTELTVTGAEQQGEDMGGRLQQLAVPEGHLAEYGRRLREGQWLLLVDVAAIDVPMVQRAFRAGGALDIDLLPESAA